MQRLHVLFVCFVISTSARAEDSNDGALFLDICATVDMRQFDLTLYCSEQQSLNVSVLAIDFLDNRSCPSWQSGFPSEMAPFARIVQQCNTWQTVAQLSGGRVMKLGLSATDMQATCARHCGEEQSCHAILRVGDMAWLALIPAAANNASTTAYYSQVLVMFAGVRVTFVVCFVVLPILVVRGFNSANMMFRFVP